MAWLVGLVDKDELVELRARGWDVKILNSEERESLDDVIADKDPAVGLEQSLRHATVHANGGLFACVYVDNDLYKIMSGPDWDCEHKKPITP